MVVCVGEVALLALRIREKQLFHCNIFTYVFSMWHLMCYYLEEINGNICQFSCHSAKCIAPSLYPRHLSVAKINKPKYLIKHKV